MNEVFRMGLMHGQFDSMTQGERMELRVRRMIGRDPVPVRLCAGRRNGKTELLRRAAELMEPGTEDEPLRRLQELMEAAITERVQGVEWVSELTPTTLRKVMQEMRKVKVPQLDPVRDQWLRMMMMPQAGLIDQNVFARVEPTDEERHIAEALYAPRETQYMGDGIARTVIADEEHGECHRIVEQYTRMSEEAMEMGSLELKVEVPVETVRAWLEAQGVTGDQ